MGRGCPAQHRINESAVLTLVSDMLRAIAEYSKNNRAEFVRTVQETQAAQQASDISKKKKRLATAQKRAGEKAIGTYEHTRKSAEKFIALVDKYENFDNLTVAMLNEFVEKILVHERDRKGSIETTQEIEIYFNFVGKYMPPHFGEVNLTPEELEALRKKEDFHMKELTYTHVGDYYIPDLKLRSSRTSPLASMAGCGNGI